MVNLYPSARAVVLLNELLKWLSMLWNDGGR